ncbi:hypothetical protein NDU88_004627 [Pleurodeles waltl]|uniref:Uncharacterized protein n=1 Tax=Pleurodeles waltl TaxID=8319 RepID=A0AAV7SJB9_PLEWA|nr:hypothetical protein NDU88_004627 [Pleurodeles waltl]
MTNQNTKEYLEKIKQRLDENLCMLPHVLGIQMHANPQDLVADESADEDDDDLDKRISIRSADKRIHVMKNSLTRKMKAKVDAKMCQTSRNPKV